MRCMNCGSEVPAGAAFCEHCGAPVGGQTAVYSKGDTGLDRSTTVLVGIPSDRTGRDGDYCPICGRFNAPESTFRCPSCGRSSICLKHQDTQTFLCAECVGAHAPAPAPPVSDLFQFTHQLVHPFLPQKRDALAQVLLTFTSREDAWMVARIPVHLCLVLDVSGSMNRPDKYPLLLQAIPNLVNTLSDDDYLTIVLFSSTHDLVRATRVGDCRGRVDAIVSRIEESGAKFGRSTLLAPGLRMALDEIAHFRAQQHLSVNRLYILTDGELHDAEECYRLNAELRSLEAEVNSYGFGKDYALETLKRLMEGIPGGTVKPIFNTEDVGATFGHIGTVSQWIIVRDAVLEFKFAPEVIPGDAFRYQPGTHWFGPVEAQNKTFQLRIGPLELDRLYTFLFEGRLPPSLQTRQQMGRARLCYRYGKKHEQIETEVFVDRTEDEWRIGSANPQALEVYQVLHALRDDDPETQLAALEARLSIYQREGADPFLVELVEMAIGKVRRGDELTPAEKRGLEADLRTHGLEKRASDCAQELRDVAAEWLQRDYDRAWVGWLIKIAERVAKSPIHDVLFSLSESERRVVLVVLEDEDPKDRLSPEEFREFEHRIR